MIRRWSDYEIEYLVNNYTKLTIDASEIAQHLNRTLSQVRSKARRLSISRSQVSRHSWTDEEKNLLEVWAETRDFTLLVKDWNQKARVMGWPLRTPAAMSRAIYKLGLTRNPVAGCYRPSEISAILGVSETLIKVNWIKSGKLKASKQNELEGSHYIIQEKALTDFAFKYPEEVSRKISPEGCCWLLQVIRDARDKNYLYKQKRKNKLDYN